MRKQLVFVCLMSMAWCAAAAGQPPAVPLDWAKLPVAGDVTRDVQKARLGDLLDLGTGKITLTPAVTLGKAEAKGGKLHLTITVEEPEQTVQFDNLIGATGSYQPVELKSRPIAIEKASHTERFIRKGVLTLAVPKPEGKRDAPAAPAVKPSVEWVDGVPVGDVTAALAATIKGGVLDFGIGRITLPPGVTLKRAVVTVKKDPPLTKVLLRFTLSVDKPDQTVAFEGLSGYLETKYHPEAGEARWVLLMGANKDNAFTVRERFEKKGEVVAEMWNTEQVLARMKPHLPAPVVNAAAKGAPAKAEPVDLAKLLPGKAEGYTPRSVEFAQLAAALSPQYIMPGRNTVRPEEQQQREAMAAAQKYPSPELQRFVKEMTAKADAVANLTAAEARKALYAQAMEIDQAIARGDYTRVETERTGRYDTGPTGQQIPVFTEKSRTVDSSGGARARAAELRALAKQPDAALLEAYRKHLKTDSMWDIMLDAKGVSNDPKVAYGQLFDNGSMALEKAAAKAAGPKAAGPLVRLSRLDGTTLQARNVGTKTLTDVYIEMRVDFREPGESKTFEPVTFLFVPVWKPGEDLFYQPVVYGVRLQPKHVFTATYNVFAAEAHTKGQKVTFPAPKK
ncbi:MAG: hypothetical protein C0467_20590 [Planctomycetaceae bacterium]|nr:hypothetical protein [Planctomycetaceae bacterium]